MKAEYCVEEKTLFVELPEGSLEELCCGTEIEKLIIGNSEYMHEKMLRIVFDDEKNSPSASIVERKEGYLITLGPLNYVDMAVREDVVYGLFSKGGVEFKIAMACY
jgi:hypothetical protein